MISYKNIIIEFDDVLIQSFLQGYMGYSIFEDKKNPKSVQIVVGDFCFFSGTPNEHFIKEAKADIITFQNEAWENLAEKSLINKVIKSKRYKMKAELNSFKKDQLKYYVESLDKDFIITKIDENIYQEVLNDKWSKDFCSLFNSYNEFSKKGLGFVILYKNQIISGASSYAYADNCIEIEIDTKKEYRNKGLAKACGSKLILECISRNIYPSWDAQDLRSVHLATTLGYKIDKEYNVFIKKN